MMQCRKKQGSSKVVGKIKQMSYILEVPYEAVELGIPVQFLCTIKQIQSNFSYSVHVALQWVPPPSLHRQRCELDPRCFTRPPWNPAQSSGGQPFPLTTRSLPSHPLIPGEDLSLLSLFLTTHRGSVDKNNNSSEQKGQGPGKGLRHLSLSLSLPLTPLSLSLHLSLSLCFSLPISLFVMSPSLSLSDYLSFLFHKRMSVDKSPRAWRQKQGFPLSSK